MTTKWGLHHHELFLGEIEASCEEHNVDEWIVIDGNHDDHFALAARCAYGLDQDGMARLGERVRYSPRGNRFELGGARFGSLGGAVSLDAWAERAGFDFGYGTPRYRTDWNWFPNLEAPKVADLEALGSEPLDVLLTHEAPAQVDMTAHEGLRGVPLPLEALGKSIGARELVGLAATNTRCRLLVHGHWHERLSTFVDFPHHRCRVEGLASNSAGRGRDERAYLLLDIAPRLGEAANAINVIDGRNVESLAS